MRKICNLGVLKCAGRAAASASCGGRGRAPVLLYHGEDARVVLVELLARRVHQVGDVERFPTEMKWFLSIEVFNLGFVHQIIESLKRSFRNIL